MRTGWRGHLLSVHGAWAGRPCHGEPAARRQGKLQTSGESGDVVLPQIFIDGPATTPRRPSMDVSLCSASHRLVCALVMSLCVARGPLGGVALPMLIYEARFDGRETEARGRGWKGGKGTEEQGGTGEEEWEDDGERMAERMAIRMEGRFGG